MENLVATLARPVTLSVKTGPAKVVTAIETMPAGTTVYVRRMKATTAEVRVPGTLLTQRVALTALLVP